ncbi:MAG TPA: hypothetical protein VJK03_04075 [Candidatus Nanoarchaeia archaeon]|nr:hypothetical protein [Candidatus Nanoarchaeia archaeon]
MSFLRKYLYAIDALVIAVTLVALLGTIQYARPLLIAPIDNFTTADSLVLFQLERGNVLLIDNTPDFLSARRIAVADSALIRLEPGTYYWKVESIVDSPVRKLIVASRLELRLRDAGEHYDVVNAGSVVANVTFYDNETIVASRLVAIGDEEPMRGTSALGVQNE